MKAYAFLAAAVAAGLCGCSMTPVKIGGATIGDMKVDDTERGWLNMARPGVGDQAQHFLGEPATATSQDDAVLAAGFKRDASMVITLKTNAVLTGRTFTDADIQSITIAPRWIAPDIQPIAVTPAQIMGQAPGASQPVNPAPTDPAPTGGVSILGLMEQIGGGAAKVEAGK